MLFCKHAQLKEVVNVTVCREDVTSIYAITCPLTRCTQVYGGLFQLTIKETENGKDKFMAQVLLYEDLSLLVENSVVTTHNLSNGVGMSTYSRA